MDLAGDVVGIPTLAATDQQVGGGAAPGIGFAISSNMVKDVAGQLVAHGKVVVSHRAALDVTVTTVVGPNGQPAGVGIVRVNAGGAADKAGLQPGDVITKLDGSRITTAEQLTDALANMRPGQQVKLTVQHANGGTAEVTVTLGRLPG